MHTNMIIQDWILMLVQFITVSGVLIGFEKWLGPVKSTYNFIKRLDDGSKSVIEIKDKFEKMEEALEEMHRKIEKIHSETQHNGGLTLKDAVSRIEMQLRIDKDFSEKGMFMCDSDAKNFYVNLTYAKKLKTQKEMLMNRGWEKFVISTKGDSWEQAFQGGREYKAELTMLTADGEEITGLVVAMPLNDKTWLGNIDFK